VTGESSLAVRRAKLVIFSSTESMDEPRLYHKVARTAGSAGYDVTSIARGAGDRMHEGIRLCALTEPKNRLTRILLRGWKVFTLAYAERADLYHFSDPELLPFGLLLQFLRRRPVIYDLCEYHGERIRQKHWLPRPLRGVLARIYEWIEVTLLGRFAGIATVNSDVASGHQARGRSVAVVPNYAPKSVFQILPERRGLSGGRHRVVIYVGVLSEERGILQAVRAMRRIRDELPNAQLWLVGPCHQAGFEDRLREEIASLGRADAVRCLGTVSHTEVPAYFAAAEVGLCLLLPTCDRYRETEPIKYFEYAAAGLPEVVSDLPDRYLDRMITLGKVWRIVERRGDAHGTGA